MSQQPIQVAESGAGFQYSPFGMLPLGTSIAPTEEFTGAAVARIAPSLELVPPVHADRSIARDARGVLPVEVQTLADIRGTTVDGTPGAVIKAARLRASAIRKELKRLSALKRELDELERLLAAAKKKPEPKVRALRAG
jgi:hypothetical protein